MVRGLDEKKFEANIPASVWEEYETWAQGRDISNRQLLKAFVRLFLGAPEWLKMIALTAQEGDFDIREGFRRLCAEVNEFRPVSCPTLFQEDALARETVRAALAHEAETPDRKASPSPGARESLRGPHPRAGKARPHEHEKTP